MALPNNIKKKKSLQLSVAPFNIIFFMTNLVVLLNILQLDDNAEWDTLRETIPSVFVRHLHQSYTSLFRSYHKEQSVSTIGLAAKICSSINYHLILNNMWKIWSLIRYCCFLLLSYVPFYIDFKLLQISEMKKKIKYCPSEISAMIF